MDTASRTPVGISPLALYRRIGSERSPLILDVRKAPAFATDTAMLPSAMRVDPEAVASWRHDDVQRPIVVYCVHGHEVSQTAAAALQERNVTAMFLEGGIAMWKELGLPLMQKRPEFGVPAVAPSRWVTREHPKIDRIACPWLIRRFVDPRAEFLYVPVDEVHALARSERAVAYDVAGAPLDHDGDRCSFDAVIRAFGLDEPALFRLAQIVRGADTGQPTLTPESPGLLAISLGLSRNFPDDHAMLAHGLVIYDALYAWCRDVCDAQREPAPVLRTA